MGDDSNQGLLGISYLLVALYMSLQLTFRTAKRIDSAKCQYFAGFKIKSAAGVEVAKAKRGKIILHVHLIRRRILPHLCYDISKYFYMQ